MLKYLWPWRRPAIKRELWPLSTPLFSLSKYDTVTMAQAMEGILCIGGTGSGKTTGSGRLIAHSFLNAGFGGLVLCVKNDCELWKQYALETGREKDLVIFGPDQPWRYNFLNEELVRKGKGAGNTENIVNLFSVISELGQRNGGKSNGGDNQYWENCNKQLCRNAVDLLIMAEGKLSIPALYKIVISAPTSLEQLKSSAWKGSSYCFECFGKADIARKSAQQQSDFQIVADYFLVEMPTLSDKTRSVIISTFTSNIDILQRGVNKSLFCGETNITPEVIPEGKIVLVDMPICEYGMAGLFANMLWKFSFQKSIERRDVGKNPRPVFLWQDEAQNLTIPDVDMRFQATCRSSRVSNVMLTQNISCFYSIFGDGGKGKAQTDALFSNLCLKIFHANSDFVSNEWASALIGKTRQFMMNANNSYQSNDWLAVISGEGPSQGSAGITEHIEFEIQPNEFTQLRTGGPDNKWNVDAILFANGRRFASTGRPWMKVTFRQK